MFVSLFVSSLFVWALDYVSLCVGTPLSTYLLYLPTRLVQRVYVASAAATRLVQRLLDSSTTPRL